MKRSYTVYNYDNRGNYGTVTITAAEEAGRVLTYPAFKVWLRFMQDRHGHPQLREISEDVFRDLVNTGYIYKNDSQDGWIFDVLRSKGTGEDQPIPESWNAIAKTYNATNKDYYAVMDILDRNGINDYDAFFTYWLHNIDTVMNLENRGEPRYPKSWDCSVLAKWWSTDHKGSRPAPTHSDSVTKHDPISPTVNDYGTFYPELSDADGEIPW